MLLSRILATWISLNTVSEGYELGTLVQTLFQKLILIGFTRDFPYQAPYVDLTFACDTSTVAQATCNRFYQNIREVCSRLLIGLLTNRGLLCMRLDS